MIDNYKDEDFFEIFKKQVHLQILCERLKLRGCDRSKIPDFFSSEFWRLSLFFEKTEISVKPLSSEWVNPGEIDNLKIA